MLWCEDKETVMEAALVLQITHKVEALLYILCIRHAVSHLARFLTRELLSGGRLGRIS